jgi:hypothetical protein
MSEPTSITPSSETAHESAAEAAAGPVAANEHAGSLRYEHVHRIEITISLLAGLAGRVRKR